MESAEPPSEDIKAAQANLGNNLLNRLAALLGRAGARQCCLSTRLRRRLQQRMFTDVPDPSHRIHRWLFAKFRKAHAFDLMQAGDLAWYRSLPPIVPAYWGGRTSTKPRLSWTTCREVAEGFARGHRGFRAPDPEVIEVGIPKTRIAFVCNDRNEAELVLFRRLIAVVIGAEEPLTRSARESIAGPRSLRVRRPWRARNLLATFDHVAQWDGNFHPRF